MTQKLNKMNTPAEQREILDKPVNRSGAGEDPAIKALLGEDFVNMNDTDALAVAIAVAKIVRGQLKEELDGTMGQLKQLMADMQNTAQKAEEDRLKFARDIFNQAEKMRVSPNEKTALDVRGSELMRKVNEEARALAITRRFEIDKRVADAPKVKMMHPGVPMTIRRGDMRETIVKPFEIHYEHLKFILPPNELMDIPDFIFEAFVKEQEMAKSRNKLETVLKGATKHYGKAIEADPVVDPEYAQRISAQVNTSGIAHKEAINA